MINLKTAGLPPLHLAAIYSYDAIAESLIKNGADIDAKFETDLTPLHRAAKRRHRKTIEVLIKYGADINAHDQNGFTPLHFAIMYHGDENITKLIIDSGA